MNNEAEITLHVLDVEAGDASTRPSESGREMEFHTLGLSRLWRKEKAIPAEKLMKSWENTSLAIKRMVEDSKKSESAGGIRLEELEVKLSVSGEGNIVFVSASAEAGIVLKFKRT